MLNIKTALEKKGITKKMYAEFLGISEKSAYNKIKGITAFTMPEANKTKHVLFPEYDIEYLFSTEPNT